MNADPSARTSRRNQHADKLRAFGEVALCDERVGACRGRWAQTFRERMGATFGGRIVFEIGCFDAAYLCRLAAKHPEVAFVGLDWKWKAIHDGAARITELGLRNVILIRGRGQEVATFFAPGEVDDVWLFHPDPCDGEKELANRLFAAPFLRDVHALLREKRSTLTLKTDHQGYYEAALRVCETMNTLFERALRSDHYWQDETALARTRDRLYANEITLFENRFVRKKKPIYFIELRKKETRHA